MCEANLMGPIKTPNGNGMLPQYFVPEMTLGLRTSTVQSSALSFDVSRYNFASASAISLPSR